MKAQIITDRKLWNDFVEKSIHCNLTQTYEWGELMEGLHSETLHVGVTDEEGQLCAVILLLISKLPVLRIPYFYAPRGPVIDDPTSPAMTVLLNFIKAEAHKRGMCMLKIEPDAHDGDEQWLIALKNRGFRLNPYANHLRREWVLDVLPPEKELLSKMRASTRRNINNTLSRKGITVRQSTKQEDIDIFYDIYMQTGHRSDFLVLAKSYYSRFIELYGDNAAFFIVEYEGKPIAAAILVRLGQWCWSMYEATADEARKFRINYMLQWHRILWAKAHGCKYFNFRGIPDTLEEGQELYGVYDFKRSFGGFDMRSLQTHDLVYRPISYAIYRVLLDVKHWYDKRQFDKKQAQKKVKNTTKDSTQAPQTAQPKEKAQAEEKTATKVQQAAD